MTDCTSIKCTIENKIEYAVPGTREGSGSHLEQRRSWRWMFSWWFACVACGPFLSFGQILLNYPEMLQTEGPVVIFHLFGLKDHFSILADHFVPFISLHRFRTWAENFDSTFSVAHLITGYTFTLHHTTPFSHLQKTIARLVEGEADIHKHLCQMLLEFVFYRCWNFYWFSICFQFGARHTRSMPVRHSFSIHSQRTRKHKIIPFADSDSLAE